MADNLNTILEKKISEAKSFLNVKLNPDDPELAKQITLGKNWDNPNEISKALDMQPAWYVRWAYINSQLKRNREKIKLEFDVWVSNKKMNIREELFRKNKDNGMTDRNARQSITAAQVEDTFNIKYNYDNEIFKRKKEKLDKIDTDIEKVSLIVEAFKQRKDTLIELSRMVKSMMENNLLYYNKKKDTK